VSLPRIEPLKLGRRERPFDDPSWIYEIKWDGFRALARLENRLCNLLSRKGNRFHSWPLLQRAIENFPASDCILDGEIVCLGSDGKPDFNSLLFRRSDPCFYAFDLLWIDGTDLRSLPVLARKERLRVLLQGADPRIRYVEHFSGSQGASLFQLCCDHDLEGVVAKRRASTYLETDHREAWLKIKNRNYSGSVGRHELFAGRSSFFLSGDSSASGF
jgi:bifunctional non-homologous end joining protein LigD